MTSGIIDPHPTVTTCNKLFKLGKQGIYVDRNVFSRARLLYARVLIYLPMLYT